MTRRLFNCTYVRSIAGAVADTLDGFGFDIVPALSLRNSRSEWVKSQFSR